MKVTKLNIRRVTEKDGLVGFVNIVLDDCLYLGNIAIFSRLNKEGYRLVFPEKKTGDKKISIFHPLTADFYFLLEQAINKEITQDK
jgi:DNA-binding cell septation regulator SpoVG